MYTLSSVESYVSQLNGSLYASLGTGSNGDENGTPTSSIGDDQGEENWDFNVWDSNSGSNFDSSDVAVQFTAFSNGDETLAVGGRDPIAYSGDSFGSISSVVLQAAVTTAGEAKWTGINVSFYNGTTLLESDSIGSGPDANTTSTPSTPQADQTLTVTTSSSDCNKVVVSGTMRLSAPTSVTALGPASLFCNVFVG